MRESRKAVVSVRSCGIKRIAWKAVMAVLCLLVLIGCGRKAPPVPPLQSAPFQAAELNGRLEGDAAILTWQRPAVERELRGYAVMRAQSTAADPACAGCPLVFLEAGRIAAEPGIEAFEFSEVVPEGFIHTYKVQPFGVSGARGQDSNRVTLDRTSR
jgi:hypothetical protein